MGILGTFPLRGIEPNLFSFQTPIRAWPRWEAGQRNVTYTVVEAGRGGGSIYGDERAEAPAQVRLRARPTFQRV